MTRALLAGAVAVAVLVASAPVVSADEDPIEQARRAAETTPFSGRVTVTWNDDGLVRQLVHRHRELDRDLTLLCEVQHLQLVEQPIDVAHLVPAGVLLLSEPPVAFGHDVDCNAGFFDHTPQSFPSQTLRDEGGTLLPNRLLSGRDFLSTPVLKKYCLGYRPCAKLRPPGPTCHP